MNKKLIFICSAYAGDVKQNTRIAIDCCLSEINSGNVPFAPHLLYPQMLSEDTDRQKGIDLGIEILKRCDEIHVYGNKITDGMRQEILFAFNNSIPTVFMDSVAVCELSKI